MSEPKWKYAEPTVMEVWDSPLYAYISWAFGEPAFNIDGSVATNTSTFTIDAIIQAVTTRTATFTIDSYIAARTTATFTLDAIIKATETGTFTLDAHIAIPTTATFTLDAIIKATKTDTFTLDAHIAVRSTQTFTLDAYVAMLSTFTLDAIISGEGVRFLYQVLQEQVSGIHTITLSKTTDGPPRSKSLWIPPCTVQWYLSISYDGTNFGDNIEIVPGQPYRLSVQARALRITIP